MPRYLLTVKKADALKAPGRYADGGGLYLSVGEGDARSWVMRIMQRGKRHDIGLGSAHFVTLAEARDAAEKIRAHAAGGGDVGTFVRQRREQAAGVLTVERAATMHFDEASKGLAERTRDMWQRQLQVALSCFLLAGGRDDRDLKLLALLGYHTFAKGKDRARLTMRQLVPWARMSLQSLTAALDRLAADGLVIRDREPGATGASVYSIDLPRLIEVSAAYDDATNGVVILPPMRDVRVRKRTRRAA